MPDLFYPNTCLPICSLIGIDHIHLDVAVAGFQKYKAPSVGSHPFKASVAALIADSLGVRFICPSRTESKAPL